VNGFSGAVVAGIGRANEGVTFGEESSEQAGAAGGSGGGRFEEESGDSRGGGKADDAAPEFCDGIVVESAEEVQESEGVFKCFRRGWFEPGESGDFRFAPGLQAEDSVGEIDAEDFGRIGGRATAV